LAARYADVWHAFGTPNSLQEASARLDELAIAADRDPKSILRAGSLSLDDVDTARRHAGKWRDAGFGYLVCGWPGAGEAQVEAFVRDVLPEFADAQLTSAPPDPGGLPHAPRATDPSP
jgi:hypothetical protein